MTTWRKELNGTIAESDDPGPVIAVAPNWDAFDVEFYDGYGFTAGPPVLAWTEKYVYFPVVYDGREWLGRAPRNPTRVPQGHIGR